MRDSRRSCATGRSPPQVPDCRPAARPRRVAPSGRSDVPAHWHERSLGPELWRGAQSFIDTISRAAPTGKPACPCPPRRSGGPCRPSSGWRSDPRGLPASGFLVSGGDRGGDPAAVIDLVSIEPSPIPQLRCSGGRRGRRAFRGGLLGRATRRPGDVGRSGPPALPGRLGRRGRAWFGHGELNVIDGPDDAQGVLQRFIGIDGDLHCPAFY